MPPTEANTVQIQALLDAGAGGAENAYNLLLSQASERLYRHTRKMLRAYPHLQRWEQTDDVFQSAAMRLHRSLAAVKPPTVAAFWGLATTQIRRTLIDLARHHFGPEGAAAHHYSEGDLKATSTDSPQPGPIASAKSGSGPESLYEWTEFHELVDKLSSEDREIFHLVWYAGLPQKDIAELMQVSLPTVQRRWHAAKLRLFELLHGESPPVDEEV